MKPNQKHSLCALAFSIATLSLPASAAQSLVCLIQPSQVAEIGSSVTGVIESMRVERGDYVKKGQVVAVLRNDVERAALFVAKSRAQAEADVLAAVAARDFAHQSTVRAEDLVKKKFVSEQALDKARTEEQVAVQKLAQTREQRRIWEREMGLAQSQLAQRTIASPISGIVAERYLSIGERIEDRAVARVVSIEPLHVEAMVPASSYGKIKTGMLATVTPELPDAPAVVARVILVDKLIDGASNTFRVRLELPNPGHAIPAGPRCKLAFGDAAIDGKQSMTLTPSARTPVTPVPKRAIPVTSPASPKKGAIQARQAWRGTPKSKEVTHFAVSAADLRSGFAGSETWARQQQTPCADSLNAWCCSQVIG